MMPRRGQRSLLPANTRDNSIIKPLFFSYILTPFRLHFSLFIHSIISAVKSIQFPLIKELKLIFIYVLSSLMKLQEN